MYIETIYTMYISGIFTVCTYMYLHIYNISSLLGLVVHLLGSHYRSQVEKL